MSIRIGEYTINYNIVEKPDNRKYIITYFDSDYNEDLNKFLDDTFNKIIPFYDRGYLRWSNVCGNNAEYICKNFKSDGVTLGKIIITEWIRNSEIQKSIEEIYGRILGSSYHALAYLDITLGEIKYYVAIETTISKQLQFYISSDRKNFANIIKSRYQCDNFRISFNCDQDWIEIAYNNGGELWDEKAHNGGKKYKIKQKTKNKKRKRKYHRTKKRV